MEIIKRKNAINSLMLNVNMVDKLKVVSDKVYDQFKSETEKVEGIVVNLIKKLWFLNKYIQAANTNPIYLGSYTLIYKMSITFNWKWV